MSNNNDNITRKRSPPRARFSTHQSDRLPAGLNRSLMQAAMADQAALQQEARLSSQQAPPYSTVRNQLAVPASPFAPNYSLSMTSPTTDTLQREEIARAVSPLHSLFRDIPDRSLTASPISFQAPRAVSSGPYTQRAQFIIDDEEGDNDVDEEETKPWVSCRERRPTCATVTKPSSSDQKEQQSVSSRSLLGSRRPSLHRSQVTETAPASTGMHLPKKPAQVYPRGNRVVSEGFPQSLYQTTRGSDGSFQSIHAAKPHIQHYNPQSSPSQVQLYRPRCVSSGPVRSQTPTPKPSLVRHDKSYDNMACELGMAGTENDDHRGGFRNAVAGLYSRVVSSDLKPQHEEDEDERRPRMQRSTSEHSIASAKSGSRKSSEDTYCEPPSLNYLSKRRKSMAFILGEDDEPKEDEDPRQAGQARKSLEMRRQYDFVDKRRGSYTSGIYDYDYKPRKRALSLASIVAPLKGFNGLPDKSDKHRKRYSNHSSLQSHMAERQKLILKLARALMLFGAPSHRVESQLNALSQVLDVDGQYIHFPGIVIASFGDIDKHTSECHFVKSSTQLALGHLNEIHTVYKNLVTDKMSVHDATLELNRLLKAKPEWSILSRVAFNTIRCGIIAPMAFGGSFVDIFMAGLFGGTLTFVQLTFAGSNPMFANVFEVTAAIVISLLARLLSVKSVFCYESVASASLCLVLPGYIICELNTAITLDSILTSIHDSVRITGVGIQKHDRRICSTGLCHHLLSFHRIRYRHWLGSLLCL
jgi:uncharacterized membrane protein YjjP (DUF1212 family)